MSDFTVQYNRGDPISASRPFYQYVYRNSSNVDSDTDAILNGLQHAFDQLYDYGAIDFYEVSLYDYYAWLDDSSKDTFKNEFDSWINGAGYLDYKGDHLGVADGFKGGKADPGDGADPTVFEGGQSSVAGTDSEVGDFKQFYKNVAIHEAFHPAIDSALDSVQSMIEDTEHDLGFIDPYEELACTPMATGYESTHAYHGSCADGGWSGPYTTFLTDCTKKAVKETAYARS